jgi:transcription elongation factor Elf1
MENMTAEEEKYCPECNHIKHLSQFHMDKSTKDGRHWRCKVCKNKYTNEHNKLKKQFIALIEAHHISVYPGLKRGIATPDIKCDHCGYEKSPSIIFQNVSHYRRSEDVLFVCRECIARNTDDIAFNQYHPVPYMTNKEMAEHNKKIALEEKQEKEAIKKHWRNYLEDDGVDIGDINDFDINV